MTDEPDTVVPLHPGIEPALATVEVQQLYEHVVGCLVEFMNRNEGERPVAMAFVIIGENDTFAPEYMINERWRERLALAGAILVNLAVAPDDDD